MSIFRAALSYLYNGMSQQAASLRHFSQCESLDNALCSVADGIRKRPPAIYIGRMVSSGAGIYPKVHHIFRSATEHYIVLLWDQSCRVFNGNTAAEISVDTTTFGGVLTYLQVVNAIKELHCLTVADTTFIVNRNKTVAAAAASIPAQPYYAFVYVKQGAPEATYYIYANGVQVSHTTGTSAASQSTATISNTLQPLVGAIPGITCTRFNNILVLNNASLTPFEWSVTDSSGGNLMVGFANRVQRYSDLPRTFVEGLGTIEVKGEGSAAGAASYWVRYVNNSQTNTGYWLETVAPNVGEVTQFDATTMPVALVKLPGGNFRLERIAWNQRLVGSTATTAPVPSFVGQKINSVFFWRGRLGFLSDENVILSRADDLYNFWPKTSVEVLDDDPIDVTVNASRVSILRHAVPFNRSLLLFSDTMQFQLEGGEVLSPRTVRADAVTEYSCSPYVQPVSTGRDVFIAANRADASGSYSSIRQYSVDQTTITNVADDITAHVPQFIGKDVFRMSTSTTEDMVVVQNEQDFLGARVYQFLWKEDKPIQSAWNRWTFPGFGVFSCELDRSTMWVVYYHTDGIHVAKMPLERAFNDTDLPFAPHLDFRLFLYGSYDAGNDRTIFTFPTYTAPLGAEMDAVTSGAWGTKKGVRLPLTRISESQYYAKGQWTAYPCYVGYRYALRYRFSQQFPKDRDGGVLQSARLQLRNIIVSLRNAAYMRAEVTASTRTTTQPLWVSPKVGGPGTLIGAPSIIDGKFRFSVMSRADRVTVDLVNDSPYPSTIDSAEVTGTLTRQA